MRVSLSLKDIFKSSSKHYQTREEVADEMTKINKDLYERNVELAIRNRTLSVLRKIYNIISTTLGVEKTSQLLIDEIVSELKFRKGFIVLVNQDRTTLRAIATSSSTPEEMALLTRFGNPFTNFAVGLSDIDNFCVNAVVTNRRRL